MTDNPWFCDNSAMFAVLTLLAHTSHEVIEKLAALDNFYVIDKLSMIESLLGMLLTTQSEEERNHNLDCIMSSTTVPINNKSCPTDMLEAILYNMTVCKQLKDTVERMLRGSLKGGAKDYDKVVDFVIKLNNINRPISLDVALHFFFLLNSSEQILSYDVVQEVVLLDITECLQKVTSTQFLPIEYLIAPQKIWATGIRNGRIETFLFQRTQLGNMLHGSSKQVMTTGWCTP